MYSLIKSTKRIVCFIKIGIIAKKAKTINQIKIKYMIKIPIKSGILYLFILFKNGTNKIAKNIENKNNIKKSKREYISKHKIKKPDNIKSFIKKALYSFVFLYLLNIIK